MKLIIAVVQDDDANDLTDVITEAGYGVTKLATTGGFLKAGNTTFMIGVDEKEIDKVISLIKDVCQKRKQVVSPPAPIVGSTGIYMPYTVEVEVGGATIFIIDVDKFIKI